LTHWTNQRKPGQRAEQSFQTFQRFNKKQDVPGNGLATVLRILERHDAQVWAKRAEVKGHDLFHPGLMRSRKNRRSRKESPFRLLN